MTNQSCLNQTRHVPHFIVAMAALTLAFATLIGPAFAQVAPTSSLKIGIIGSGNMGSTLGTLWVKSGHPVLFSSRHPEELKKLVDGLGPLARAGTVREALAFGDVIFIAVRYAACSQIGTDYAQEVKGEIVIGDGEAVQADSGESRKDAW